MPVVYVPLNSNDIQALKRCRDARLRAAELGDMRAYDDCIRLDTIIDAHQNLEPVSVDQWKAQRAHDLRAIAQEWTA